MSSQKRFEEAIKSVTDRLMAMPGEDFRAMLEKHKSEGLMMYPTYEESHLAKAFAKKLDYFLGVFNLCEKDHPIFSQTGDFSLDEISDMLDSLGVEMKFEFSMKDPFDEKGKRVPPPRISVEDVKNLSKKFSSRYVAVNFFRDHVEMDEGDQRYWMEHFCLARISGIQIPMEIFNERICLLQGRPPKGGTRDLQEDLKKVDWNSILVVRLNENREWVAYHGHYLAFIKAALLGERHD